MSLDPRHLDPSQIYPLPVPTLGDLKHLSDSAEQNIGAPQAGEGEEGG